MDPATGGRGRDQARPRHVTSRKFVMVRWNRLVSTRQWASGEPRGRIGSTKGAVQDKNPLTRAVRARCTRSRAADADAFETRNEINHAEPQMPIRHLLAPEDL